MQLEQHTTCNNTIPTSLSFARTFEPQTLEDLLVDASIIDLIETLVSGTYPTSVRNSIIFKVPKGRGKSALCSIMNRMALERGIFTHLVDINSLVLSNAVFDGIINHAKSASVKYKLVILDNIDTCDNDSQNNISRFIDVYKNTIFVSTATVCYNMDESLRTKSNITSISNYSMTESRTILYRMLETMMVHKHQITHVSMDNLIDKCDYNMRSMMNYIETVYLFGMTGDHVVGDEIIDEITDVNINDSIGKFLDCVRHDKFDESISIIDQMTAKGKSNIDILFSIFGYISKHSVLTEVENIRITQVIGKYIVVLNLCDDSLYMSFIVNDMIKVLK